MDGTHGTPEVSPTPLMEIMYAFTGAATLAAATELDVFGRVDKAGGLTRQEAARELGIADRPADLLLAACASLGLLAKQGESYVNTPLSDAYLVPGRARYLGGLIRFMHHRQFPAWLDLATAVRGNRPVTWDPDTQPHGFANEDPAILPLFWETMFAMSTSTGRELARTLPELGERRSVLDVGGGWGAMVIQLCQHFPRLRATVYDLDTVCQTTAVKVRDAGLDERIGTAPGDFFLDEELPGGHDVILLSSILHDWDEDEDRALLAKCFRALPSGGMIVISEFFLNNERTGPPNAALMGLTMLIETLGGKNYAVGEYRTWLAEAGFEHTELLPFAAAGSNGVLVARKP